MQVDARGRKPIASQPPAARRLRFGNHDRAVRRALEGKLLGDVLGRSDFFVMMNPAADLSGLAMSNRAVWICSHRPTCPRQWAQYASIRMLRSAARAE